MASLFIISIVFGLTPCSSPVGEGIWVEDFFMCLLFQCVVSFVSFSPLPGRGAGVRPQAFLRATVAFWPPKPKVLLMAMSAWYLRAELGV